MSSHALSVSAVRAQVARWFSILMDACLGLTIVLVPGLAAASFEQGELYKQALFVGLVAIAVTASCIKAALLRRAEVVFGWLQVVLIVFGFVALLSSFRSLHPYLSFLGDGGQRSWAWFSLAALIAFVLLLAQRTKTAVQAYNTLFLMGVGGIGLAGSGIWSMVTRAPVNAAGSVYALTVALAPLLVMGVGLIFHGARGSTSVFSPLLPSGRLARVSVWLLSFLAMGVLFAVNFWLSWVMFLVGFAVVMGLGAPFARRSLFVRGGFVGMAALMAIGSLAFSVPWKGSFPSEVALSQRASWEIAQQSLATHPLLGTGLGTWVYNHAAYRAQIMNASPFWATSFDRGISVLLTMLVTMGILGVILFLWFLGGVLISSLRTLKRFRAAGQDEFRYVLLILFAAWVPFLVASIFYTFNFAHQLLFWTLTGCLLGLVARRRFVFEAVRPAESLVLAGRAVVVSVVCLAVFVLGGQTLWAQTRLRAIVQAYQAGSVSVDETIASLERVRVIHPWSDVSARTLSQAYLIRVLAQIKDKPATEQARLVGDDVTRMVDAALEAIHRAPAQPENWANAGLVYASIASFTRGADEFALKQYEEAMRRDPQTPIYPTEMAKVYLMRADMIRPLTDTKDAQAAKSAREDERKALAQALASVRAALALKADYLPARYYAAVILDRQGNTAAALKELERVVAEERTPDRVFELGILYVRASERTKAIAAFEYVLKADPSQMRAHWQLASLYEEMDRLPEALAQLRLVAASAPTNASLQKRLQSLEARVKAIKPKQ